jgi:hypothetical protein
MLHCFTIVALVMVGPFTPYGVPLIVKTLLLWPLVVFLPIVLTRTAFRSIVVQALSIGAIFYELTINSLLATSRNGNIIPIFGPYITACVMDLYWASHLLLPVAVACGSWKSLPLAVFYFVFGSSIGVGFFVYLILPPSWKLVLQAVPVIGAIVIFWIGTAALAIETLIPSLFVIMIRLVEWAGALTSELIREVEKGR